MFQTARNRTASRRHGQIARRRRQHFFRLSIEKLEERWLLAAITVTGIGDTIAVDGLITLREAITSANDNANVNADVAAVGAYGSDTIRFNVPGAGVHTISPASPLPVITEAVTIDGYTQPGTSANTNTVGRGLNSVLLIELNGISAGPNADGLAAGTGSSNSTFRGLVINRFTGKGIRIVDNSGSSDNIIEGNLIGTDVSGTVDLGNGTGGVLVGARTLRNRIGGTSPGSRNVISGNNGTGIQIKGGATSTRVQGNLIGTNRSGTQDLGNSDVGVSFGDSGVGGSADLVVGGTTPGAGNVISGNDGWGVHFSGTLGTNFIQGNYIGTDVTGTLAIGNGTVFDHTGGIGLEGGNTTIGGTSPLARNVISGNKGPGILTSGAGSFSAGPSLVLGNFIGTQADGKSPLGNGSHGFENGRIAGGQVGGTTAGDGNIIAFNGGAGILLDGSLAVLGNSIFSNVRGIRRQFFQAAPVLTSVLSTDRHSRIEGTLHSTANTSFRIEFFNNVAQVPPGLEEGQTFIGATTATTNAAGDATFAANLPFGLAFGQFITATATGSGANTSGTSEFSLALPSRVAVLGLGETVSGTITGQQNRFFRVDVPAATDVLLAAHFNLLQGVQVFVRYGDLPSPANFDQVVFNNQLNDEILLTGAAGPYYILVHGTTQDAVRGFDLTATARTGVFEVRSISSNRGSNVGQATTILTGSGFTLDAVVNLVASDGSLRPATVALKDGNTLFATFDLTGLAAGIYHVRIDDRGRTATASAAYTVTEGTPGVLDLKVRGPGRVRVSEEQGGSTLFLPSSGVVTVEYTNLGDTDIPAPLLRLTSGDGVFVLPGQERGALGTQFLGINGDGPAGILPPGAKGRVSFDWWSGTSIGLKEFQLFFISPEAPFDWNAVKNSMRPTLIPADAWDAIFANFTARVGTTLGEYQSLLNENSTYLSRLGQTTSDVGRLLGFIFQQADNAFPQRALASAVDAAAPAPGLPLTFTRTDLQSITRRYALGEFGRGWTHNWDFSVQPDGQGNLTVQTPGGSRLFRIHANGTFEGVPGETGTFTRGVDFYSLREEDGTLFTFRLADGKMSLIQDPNGNSITLNYVDGLLTSLVHSNGDRFTIGHNAQGRISQLTDQAGRITTYAYDLSGEHLLSATGPGGTTAYTYESDSPGAPGRTHALRSITNPDGTHVLYDYDAAGRLVRQERDGGVEATAFAYDAAGGVTITDATGAASKLFFNEAGQVAESRDAIGRIQSFRYDANSRLIRTLAPENLAVLYRYDSRGNRTSTVDSLGRETDQTYDLTFNHVLSYSDQRIIETGYRYDAHGNLTAIDYPDGNAEQFSHDAAGNLIQSLNRRGQGIDYSYDGRGLLIRKDHADGSHEDFTHDARGNLVTATDAQGTTTFKHDGANRLIGVLYPSGRSLDYTYDAGGRRTQMVDQDGFEVHYAYDAAGRLARLSDAAGTTIVAYTNDLAGRLARADKGNSTFTSYEYDAAGQLSHLVNHAVDGSVNSRFDYAYNDLGLRTSMTTLDGLTTYGYDALGQLTSVALPGGRTIEYVYDAVGNRVSVTDAGAVTNYTANDSQQYVTVGSSSRAYDADGNLISETVGGLTSTYAYDDENRLVSVVTPAGTWNYEYDPLGNRIATIENGLRTDYLIDPTGLGNVAGEYAASGNLTAHFVHGLGLTSRLDAAGQAAFYDFDAIGSTAGLTGSSGNYVNAYSYLPFGESLTARETISNPFTYVGQLGVRHEGNGLDFMRARFFSPSDGRFINEDPIGHAGGLNIYNYTSNNPLSRIDPTGLAAEQWIAAWLTRGGTGVYLYADAAIGGAAAGETAIIVLPGAMIQAGAGGAAVEIGAAAGAGLGLGAAAGVVGGVCFFADCAGAGAGLGVVAGLAACLLSPDSCGPELFPDAFPPAVPGNPSPGSPLPGNPKPPPHPDNPGPGSPTRVVRSFDPNDIFGPAGFGAEGFVRMDQTFPYTITFENLSAATAPAQTVVITQQLDTDLDLTTFEIGELGFGNQFIHVPVGQNFFSTRVDLRDTLGLFVDIDAGLDTTTGIVTWNFTSIDPATEQVPTDPGIGFLPPNVTAPEGDGFVTYYIRPRAGLATGTRVDAQGSIVFDTNAAIDTPAIFHTLDAAPPTSSVNPLPPITAATSFPVSWSGTDDLHGSGIATFDIYVSIDAAVPVRWLNGTALLSAEYPGELGKSYAFYSIATDAVGQQEVAPPTPDAKTLVTLSIPWQNISNRFDVDDSGDVSPLDVLVVINDLNTNGSRRLPASQNPFDPKRYIDVDGDGFSTPLDVLSIINFLNQRGRAEGESRQDKSEATMMTSQATDILLADLSWLDGLEEKRTRSKRNLK